MRNCSFCGRFIHAILMICVAIAIFGVITMHLWNAIIPDLFALSAITFPQACGLVVLGRLLFGSHAHAMMFFGGRRGGWHHHGHERLRQRWNQMTPEEREKMWEHFHHHRSFDPRNHETCGCGHHDEAHETCEETKPS